MFSNPWGSPGNYTPTRFLSSKPDDVLKRVSQGAAQNLLSFRPITGRQRRADWQLKLNPAPTKKRKIQ